MTLCEFFGCFLVLLIVVFVIVWPGAMFLVFDFVFLIIDCCIVIVGLGARVFGC